MKPIIRFVCAITFALASAAVFPQTATQPSITAEQVLDRSVEASGGKQKLANLKTAVLRGTLEAPTQGLQGSVVTYIKAPNKIRVETDISAFGKTLEGFDGKVAWAKDPIQGLRKLEGAEKAAMVRGSSIFSTDWRQFYSKATYIGTDKVGDREVHVVEVTPKESKPVRQFFDAETFLLLKQTGVQQGPMGEMPFEAFFTDYKEFKGLKIPMKQIVKVGPIEFQIVIKDIQSGIPVDDKLFVMPAY